VSLVIDNPSFLKVNIGQEITAGEVISDNTIERGHLAKRHKSIELKIQNLKDKYIHKLTEPNFPVEPHELAPANYSEEEFLIKNARMKLSQARSMLKARTSC
jgi:hypothetical protein